MAGTPVITAPPIHNGIVALPVTTNAGSVLYVFYADTSIPSNFMFQTYIYGAPAWSTPELAVTTNSTVFTFDVIQDASGTIVLAWKSRDGPIIYYANSTDFGDSWSPVLPTATYDANAGPKFGLLPVPGEQPILYLTYSMPGDNLKWSQYLNGGWTNPVLFLEQNDKNPNTRPQVGIALLPTPILAFNFPNSLNYTLYDASSNSWLPDQATPLFYPTPFQFALPPTLSAFGSYVVLAYAGPVTEHVPLAYAAASIQACCSFVDYGVIPGYSTDFDSSLVAYANNLYLFYTVSDDGYKTYRAEFIMVQLLNN